MFNVFLVVRYWVVWLNIMMIFELRHSMIMRSLEIDLVVVKILMLWNWFVIVWMMSLLIM